VSEWAQFELKSIRSTRTHPAIATAGPLQVEWGFNITEHENTCNYRLAALCCQVNIEMLLAPSPRSKSKLLELRSWLNRLNNTQQ